MIAGCAPNKSDVADRIFSEAVRYMDEGNFNMAKLKLDSIIRFYDDRPRQAKQAKEMLNRVNIKEQEKSLQFLDSMLKENEKLKHLLVRNFVSSEDVGTGKFFTHRRQLPANSFNRTFIKAHLNEQGDFFISSRYHGQKWIDHQQIRAYYRDKSVLSQVVPADGVNNRRFENSPDKWEVINFRDGLDNGIIDFIASNWQLPIRIQFIGQEHHFIILEQFDREAIRDGYELSFIFRDIQKIKEEKEIVNSTLRQLKMQN